MLAGVFVDGGGGLAIDLGGVLGPGEAIAFATLALTREVEDTFESLLGASFDEPDALVIDRGCVTEEVEAASLAANLPTDEADDVLFLFVLVRTLLAFALPA